MQATVKQRILLHLYNYFRENHSGKPSYYTSQQGITSVVDASRGYVSKTLTEMMDKDLVEEETEDVGKNKKRRIKVYRLTSKGREKAKNTRKKFLEKKFTIKTLEEKKRIKGKELENHISTDDPLLTTLVRVDKEGKLDITEYEKLDRNSFVNRKKELENLKEYLEYVIENGSMTIFISGESGCGKTELCLEFKRELEKRTIYFLTGKVRTETSISFSPFIKAFKGHKHDIIDINLKKIDLASIKTDNNNFFQDKKRLYFQKITDQIQKASSKKPMVIFLDDLQSADAATIELLKFLTKNLGEAPVLFLCTYRYEEISEDHLLNEVKGELDDIDSCQNIILNNFDFNQSREFLFELTRNPDLPLEFVKLLHNMTRGNPLFLKEFVKLLIEEEKIPPHSSSYPTREKDLKIPMTLKDVTKKRIESHISKKARKLVLLGCVIGNPIPIELLREMISERNIDLLDCIEELLEKNIWDKGDDENYFYFSHKFISKVAYKNIPPWKRKKMHLLAAKKIKELYHECIEDYYPDLARHYEKGEDISTAVEYYIMAGRESENVLAHEDAVKMYKKVVCLSEDKKGNPEDKLHMFKKISRSYLLLGRFEKSRVYLAESAKLVDDQNEKRWIYMKIAETYILQRRFDTALTYLEDALSLSENKDAITCKILSHIGWIHIKKENLNEAERVFKKEKEIAEKYGKDREKGQVYQDLGVISHLKKEYEPAINEFKRALEIREKLDDKIGLISLNSNIAKAYQYTQELKKAKKYFKKALEISEKVGDKVRLFHMSADLGLYQFDQGKLKKSLKKLKRSYKIADQLKDEGFKLLISYYLSKVYLTKGDLQESKTHLKKCKEIIKGLNDDFVLSKKRECKGTLKSIDYNYIHMKILFVESELKKKKGNLEEAKEKLLEVRNLAENKDEQWILAQIYCLLGKIYSLKGVFEKGKECYENGERIAEKIEHNKMESSCKEGLAKIELMRGKNENARILYKDALKLAEKYNYEKLIIQNLNGLGECYLKIYDIEDAEKYLSMASKKIKNREEPELKIQNNILKGKLYLNKRDLENAESSLKRALDECEKANDHILKCKSLYESTRLYFIIEKKSKAEKQLECSIEMFDEMGMRWWKKKAKRSLSKLEQGSNFHDLA